MITLDEFKKMELVVARVTAVEEIPGADKLWKLRIDTGAEPTHIVAGIKEFYPSKSILGKDIVVIRNLQPAVIRGVESQGMLLAVKDGRRLALVTVDQEVTPGSPIS